MKKLCVLFLMISLQSHALYKTVVNTLGAGLERLQMIPSQEEMARNYQINPRGKAAELLYQQVCTLQHGESAKTKLVTYCLQDALTQENYQLAHQYLEMLQSKHAKNYLQGSHAFRQSCWYDQSLQRAVLQSELINSFFLDIGWSSFYRFDQMPYQRKLAMQYPLVMQTDIRDFVLVDSPDTLAEVRFLGMLYDDVVYAGGKTFLSLHHGKIGIIDLDNSNVTPIHVSNLGEIQAYPTCISNDTNVITSMCVSSAARRCAYITSDGKHFLCDITIENQLQPLWQSPCDTVSYGALSVCGRYCLSLNSDSATVYDCNTQQTKSYTLSNQIVDHIRRAGKVSTPLTLNHTGTQIAFAHDSHLTVIDLEAMTHAVEQLPQGIASVEFTGCHDLVLVNLKRSSFDNYQYHSGVYAPSRSLFCALPGKRWATSAANGVILSADQKPFSSTMSYIPLDQLHLLVTAVDAFSFDQLLLVKLLHDNTDYQPSSPYEQQLYATIDPLLRSYIEKRRATKHSEDNPEHLRDQVASLCNEDQLVNTTLLLKPSVIAALHTVQNKDFFSLVSSPLATDKEHQTAAVSKVKGIDCLWLFDHVSGNVTISKGGLKPWRFARMIEPGCIIGLQAGHLFIRKTNKAPYVCIDPKEIHAFKRMDRRLYESISNAYKGQQQLAQHVVSASLSDDGGLLVYRVEDHEAVEQSGLFVVRLGQLADAEADSAKKTQPILRTITYVPLAQGIAKCCAAACSGDGTQLVIATRNEQGVIQLTTCAIQDTVEITNSFTTDHETQGALELAVNKTGSQIACTTGNRITVYDSSGFELAELVDPAIERVILHGFSACGRFLLYRSTTSNSNLQEKLMHIATGVTFGCTAPGDSYCFDAQSYSDLLVRSEVSFDYSSRDKRVYDHINQKTLYRTVQAASWDDCERLTLILKDFSFDQFALLDRVMSNHYLHLDQHEYALFQSFDPLIKDQFADSVQLKDSHNNVTQSEQKASVQSGSLCTIV